MIYIILLVLIIISLRYNWWRIPIPYSQPRVLMYHMIKEHLTNSKKRNKWRVKPKDFEKQMAWFSKHGWHSYTISEMVEAKELPPKSFCITFDDGYADNFTYALPVLKQYGIKATIYLVPDYEYNSWEKFENKNYDRLLACEQIKQMQKSGLIEFGSHTLHHKNLLTISEEEAEVEIKRSKQAVEQIIGMECKAFAYPYGKYDENTVKLVVEAGYTSATVVKRGFFEAGKPFEIKRVGVLGTESFVDFYLKITRIRNKL
ncbi:polysaccharide deacetylase family protein [Sulfurovum sp.]|uniref:polysaccharide deacetylase family protein n=1 Tax=Sulfurovum sp. TaxID=1969726 RepID=UPI0025DE847B|nr:polysaccharide deacetylase family protein [Sulfurovum sp.]